MAGLDPQTIRHALMTAQKHGFAEIELELDGERFSAVSDPVPAPAKSSLLNGAVVVAETGSPGPGEKPIPAPFVGFYRALETPLQAGHRVEKGEIVASIAALGLANDVESPVTGEVLEVLVEPGQAVEYGQPLARVREG